MAELQGDLISVPSRDRELWDEEVYALDFILRSGRCPSNERSTMEEIIRYRQDMLHSELQAANHFTDQLIKTEVHHQLRYRPDFRKEDCVVEQWIPAFRCWLICGRFPADIPASEIIRQLRGGDPRVETAEQALAKTREIAATNRARLDSDATQRVLDTIGDMSTSQIDKFIEVETAIKHGETIVAHGPDLAFLESAHAKTKAAAAAGDLAAQSTLTHGQQDTALCVNPGDNPLRR